MVKMENMPRNEEHNRTERVIPKFPTLEDSWVHHRCQRGGFKTPSCACVTLHIKGQHAAGELSYDPEP